MDLEWESAMSAFRPVGQARGVLWVRSVRERAGVADLRDVPAAVLRAAVAGNHPFLATLPAAAPGTESRP